MIFKLGELFCGPGGMAIAAAKTAPILNKQTGESFEIRHSWGVDFSEAAIKTFKQNLGPKGAEAICEDARRFTKDDLIESRRIDALAFGFPCNSFSNVGEHEGLNSKKYGSLYREGIKVLNRYQPVWFIAENVSGISGHENGTQFRTILQDLANCGYNVVANLYKFEQYGVPQARHRYVMVGIRSDFAEEDHLTFRIPAPTTPNECDFVTAEQALATVRNTTTWGKELTRQSDQVIWRLRFTPPGENAWKLDEIVGYPDQDLLNYLMTRLPWYKKEIAPLGTIQTIRAQIEYARLHVKTKARMSHIYRRLEANKPAYTLTGSGGGGTHIYHWSEPRALTNEERAALQTFPKDFVFCGSKEEIRKQIGMAVPTKGAKAIFTAILKTFAGVPYAGMDPNPEWVFTPHHD